MTTSCRPAEARCRPVNTSCWCRSSTAGRCAATAAADKHFQLRSMVAAVDACAIVRFDMREWRSRALNVRIPNISNFHCGKALDHFTAVFQTSMLCKAFDHVRGCLRGRSLLISSIQSHLKAARCYHYHYLSLLLCVLARYFFLVSAMSSLAALRFGVSYCLPLTCASLSCASATTV